MTQPLKLFKHGNVAFAMIGRLTVANIIRTQLDPPKQHEAGVFEWTRKLRTALLDFGIVQKDSEKEIHMQNAFFIAFADGSIWDVNSYFGVSEVDHWECMGADEIAVGAFSVLIEDLDCYKNTWQFGTQQCDLDHRQILQRAIEITASYKDEVVLPAHVANVQELLKGK